MLRSLSPANTKRRWEVKPKLHLNRRRSCLRWWATWIDSLEFRHSKQNGKEKNKVCYNKCGWCFWRQTTLTAKQLLEYLSVFFMLSKGWTSKNTHSSYTRCLAILSRFKSIAFLVNQCYDTSVQPQTTPHSIRRLVLVRNKLRVCIKRTGRKIMKTKGDFKQ